jgi:wyosine [tRNA(Phe)-imidazoG37] synthetase (radical SAM superfamily)
MYGPVRSRRLGRSLGINVLPAGLKVCNMACAYCQYGSLHGTRQRAGIAWPSPARIEAALSLRLRTAADRDELIDRITVAGHGEPTLHPEFEDIAERVCRVRDAVAPRIPLAILSNSTTSGMADVQRGLRLFDERHMKLDAGDPITCARINGPGLSLRTVVGALRDLPRVIVQSMFVTQPGGVIDNTRDPAVQEWLSALELIQPSRVEIYTIDRPPAVESVRPASPRRLREIAARLGGLGITASVFTAQTPHPIPAART